MRYCGFTFIAVFAIATIASVPVTSAFQVGSNDRVMWETHCTYFGSDYGSKSGLADACGDICADDSTCTHWTWNSFNGGTCWLKSGTTSTKFRSSGADCGYVVSRSSSTATSPSSNGLSASDSAEMLAKLNEYRAQNDLVALTIDDRLTVAAALHSQDQASHCEVTHTGWDGLHSWDRVKAQGYDYSVTAENVAGGQKTVDDVMTSWWNSAGHRANILNGDLVNVGFALASNPNCSNYVTYWTQDFGSEL
ncbi:hypothetical protein BBJ28_00008425 [Nothophytophthora sp. Chile5]|nr:hypothetical protein BBJ28_00008425 [Nothophytophthora sp. Chile5]